MRAFWNWVCCVVGWSCSHLLLCISFACKIVISSCSKDGHFHRRFSICLLLWDGINRNSRLSRDHWEPYVHRMRIRRSHWPLGETKLRFGRWRVNRQWKTKIISCSLTKLGNYSVPDTMTSIDSEAFCEQKTGFNYNPRFSKRDQMGHFILRWIVLLGIPGSVGTMGASPFAGRRFNGNHGCWREPELQGGQWYLTQQRCNKTHLLSPQKSGCYEIPSTVKIIDNNAFSVNENLISIHSRLHHRSCRVAFAECHMFAIVTMLRSAASIDKLPFMNAVHWNQLRIQTQSPLSVDMHLSLQSVEIDYFSGPTRFHLGKSIFQLCCSDFNYNSGIG